ncbi:hypothetical protein WJX74_008245 [Apatococcus lobatus]|uniref:Uncharacterized protein n=1 Tax=Apatococcus lobatus TaxID=904363 RepID=A0AAW1Q8B7_9CHLO
MQPRGQRRSPLIGQDDKRKITGMRLTSADGEMGPMQLILQGTTERSIRGLLPLLEGSDFDGWEFTTLTISGPP